MSNFHKKQLQALQSSNWQVTEEFKREVERDLHIESDARVYSAKHGFGTVWSDTESMAWVKFDKDKDEFRNTHRQGRHVGKSTLLPIKWLLKYEGGNSDVQP